MEMVKKILDKINLGKVLKIICFLLFIGLLSGCVTLSEKTERQNIKIATSSHMVQGMENVYTYTTDVGSAHSIDEIGIMAANNAAKNGWSNITILVQYVRPGNTESHIGDYWLGAEKTMAEISYWK
jgi:hypothetical protein